jgi:CMP-N-acetylneuraminic acid synthetase
MRMKKTVAFVPVKLNNERLPGKNTKAFEGGEPLISYILKALKRVQGIDEIIVYCSDESICEFLPEGVRFLKRDPYLDLNTTLILEVLQYFAKDVEADVYVLAHATAPFLRAGSIEEGVKAVAGGAHDSAMTVTPVREFVWHNGQPLYDTMKIPRTQDLRGTFAETTGLYVYTKELIAQGRRIGDNPRLVEVGYTETVDINNPEDFVIAQQVFNQLKEQGEI